MKKSELILSVGTSLMGGMSVKDISTTFNIDSDVEADVEGGLDKRTIEGNAGRVITPAMNDCRLFFPTFLLNSALRMHSSSFFASRRGSVEGKCARREFLPDKSLGISSCCRRSIAAAVPGGGDVPA